MDGEIYVGMGLKILYLQVSFVSKYSFYSTEMGLYETSALFVSRF